MAYLQGMLICEMVLFNIKNKEITSGQIPNNNIGLKYKY